MSQDPVDSITDALDEQELEQSHASSSPPQENTDDEISNNKSALQDNIERKGKNAYYFAHAHKSTGPKWDGKQEPKLLAKQESQHHEFKKPAFDYSKSNIRKYAFLDEPNAVKLYIELEGIGETCSNEDIVLEYTSTSMSLVIQNYNPNEPLCLVFGKLTASIEDATWKKKKDKLIVTLTKTNEGEWHTICDKGTPDHQVV